MTIWYLARGAGLAALVLFTAATALGAIVSRPAPVERRVVLQYLHRATAGLGLTVLALHLTTILADSYAHVGWRGALVPFLSGYRPTWVAFGTLAGYLFVGVSVLGLARGRMAATAAGARVWRGLHALAYLGWVAAVVHGFFSGTDSSVGWVRALYVCCLLAVVGAVSVRLADVVRDRSAGPAVRRHAMPRPPLVPTPASRPAGATTRPRPNGALR